MRPPDLVHDFLQMFIMNERKAGSLNHQPNILCGDRFKLSRMSRFWPSDAAIVLQTQDGTGASNQQPDLFGRDDLRNPDVRKRLAAIWTDPKSLDPSAQAARVTREIADLLATVSCRLEARGHSAEAVSGFLMRVLFTMFAEDRHSTASERRTLCDIVPRQERPMLQADGF